jgi:hypothetical protein
VVIWSAVLASSAIPCVLEPMTLYAKDAQGLVTPYFGFGKCWSDGTIKNDLPMTQLAEMFNVNYFIVSQCNPHIVPFFFHHRGASGNPASRRFGSQFRGQCFSFVMCVLVLSCGECCSLMMCNWLAYECRLRKYAIVFVLLYFICFVVCVLSCVCVCVCVVIMMGGVWIQTRWFHLKCVGSGTAIRDEEMAANFG